MQDIVNIFEAVLLTGLNARSRDPDMIVIIGHNGIRTKPNVRKNLFGLDCVPLNKLIRAHERIIITGMEIPRIVYRV